MGLAWSALGALGFSLTLTATRAAVPELGGVLVGFGRAVIAGALAAVLLWLRREALPRQHVPGLLAVALGVVIGFPALTACALGSVPVSHAMIVTGLSPLATAAVASVRAGERPSRALWAAGCAGAALVLTFAMLESGGAFHVADLWLLLAVALVGVGYAEGGRLARELGGFRVICWALVLALPVTLLAVGCSLWRATPASPSARAWLGLGYVSLVSMFLAFFAWYRGLAVGGIARASQVQLLMPFAGMGWAHALLGEPVSPRAWLFGGLLLGCVAFAGRAPRRVPRAADPWMTRSGCTATTTSSS